MRYDVFMRLIETQELNKVYRYWNDEDGMMLYITRSIRGEETFFDVEYGTHHSHRINRWQRPEFESAYEIEGYYHGHPDEEITAEDFFWLNTKSLIPRGCSEVAGVWEVSQ